MVSGRRLHLGWLAFGVVCFIAASVAGLMMSIAWDHNPQLVFHEDGIIHWDAWLTVGLTWFFAIAGIACVIAFAVVVVSFFRGNH
jgi:hypothetical protein